MLLRLVKFSLGENKLSDAQAIFADLVPQIRAQPGCNRITAFGDAKTGAYGMAVVWESAEAGKRVIGPQLSRHLAASHASDQPFSTELFEILDS